MAKVTVNQLAETLAQIQAQIADVSKRLAKLEGSGIASAETHPLDVAAAAPVVVEEPGAALTEEQLLAVAAAIGAYLGVRVHIRQIRLLSSSAWSQQGRVSIQASHRLHS